MRQIAFLIRAPTTGGKLGLRRFCEAGSGAWGPRLHFIEKTASAGGEETERVLANPTSQDWQNL